jgi:hypothetical protein
MVETADTVVINADDLAIDDRVLHREPRQVFPQGLKPRLVGVARQNLAFTILDVHYCPKAIVLQFEDVVGNREIPQAIHLCTPVRISNCAGDGCSRAFSL